jgi:hypothetical protein
MESASVTAADSAVLPQLADPARATGSDTPVNDSCAEADTGAMMLAALTESLAVDELRPPRAADIQSPSVPAPRAAVITPALQPGAGAPAADKLAPVSVPKAEPVDVVAAYKLFLGRQPESPEVIQLRVGHPADKLLLAFLTSPEFLSQQQNANLVLAVARQILLEQAPVSAQQEGAQQGGAS